VRALAQRCVRSPRGVCARPEVCALAKRCVRSPKGACARRGVHARKSGARKSGGRTSGARLNSKVPPSTRMKRAPLLTLEERRTRNVIQCWHGPRNYPIRLAQYVGELSSLSRSQSGCLLKNNLPKHTD